MARRLFFAILILFSFAYGWQPPQLPELEVKRALARRAGDTIGLDGTVKNVSKRPLHRLVLQFVFLASAREVVTVRKVVVVDGALNPGEESSFSYELRDEPRAIQFRILAGDAKNEKLRISGAGPYPIQ
jgi:hypothetical protein